MRSELPQEEWDRLRYSMYKKANYLCEICSGRGDRHPVECHEVWEYDESDYTQRLTGLVCLCPDCHSVKHFGFASLNGKRDEAFNHLKTVNKWTDEEANEYLSEVWSVWAHRSQHDWKLDLSWLHKAAGKAVA